MGTRTVLALDLEGTLISNEFSQIPRPGLPEFLELCRSVAPRVVIFTTVSEASFRKVATNLVSAGDAPDWFTGLDVVGWDGAKKDLLAIKGATLQEIAMVDDDPDRFAIPDQLGSWFRVKYFGFPYPEDDTGLLDIAPALRRAFP